MSEWWSYRVGDFLMFSARTYDRLFERYNADVWPLHLVAVAIGIIILWQRRHPRVIAALLAVAWLWVAYAFFWERFSTIHTFAKWFALAFAVEAVLLSRSAVATATALDRQERWLRHRTPIFAIILVLYPLFPPRHELFGIAPDPTALATLVLVPGWRTRIIPILWCAFSAATHLAMASR